MLCKSKVAHMAVVHSWGHIRQCSSITVSEANLINVFFFVHNSEIKQQEYTICKIRKYGRILSPARNCLSVFVLTCVVKVIRQADASPTNSTRCEI